MHLVLVQHINNNVTFKKRPKIVVSIEPVVFKLSDPSGRGSGIHIHIEDSVLNALLERVPWADVFESLNNKLSRTEETKHIREHIYKTASEKDMADHRQWNNWRQNGLNFNRVQRSHLQSAPSTVQVARHRNYCQSAQHYSQWYRYYCQRPPIESSSLKPQVFQRTWKSPRGRNQEYTFRHTIIQSVKKPQQDKRFSRPYGKFAGL